MRLPPLRSATALLIAGAILACSDPTRPASHVKGIAAAPESVLMTGPGVFRIAVEVQAPLEEWTFTDTVDASIETTGPFSGTWSVQRNYRRLHLTASQPGTGTVTIRAGDKSLTIPLTAVALSFREVSTSRGYGCAIAADETAWCWGGNWTGQTGFPTPSDCNGAACQYGGNSGNASPLPVLQRRPFVKVETAGSECYQMVTGICGRTCALTASGEAWCWGSGFGVAPKRAAPDHLFKSITLHANGFLYPGGAVSCGLATDGKAWCFTATTVTPLAPSLTFQSLSIGRFHSCGVDLAGDVWCWGDNSRGSLGIGSADTQLHPDPVKATNSAKFTSVEVAEYSTCALDTTNALHCWGEGYASDGATPPPVCTGTTRCSSTPRLVEGARAYVSFSRGDYGPYTCALTAAGAVDCWSFYNRAPMTITFPEPMADISVGGAACGVTVSGEAWCWNPLTSAISKLIS